VYCSLDKIDLTATIGGRHVAVQTDHRSAHEIEDEPELSALFAMTRVLNARSHFGRDPAETTVHYATACEPPPVLREALTAVGATLERIDHASAAGATLEPLGEPSESEASELADLCFRELARKAAIRVGSRDVAMALRMLEDQILADPPPREDEARYWQRVMELAALTGELLRTRYPGVGCWVQTDRAVVPFGFQLAAGGATVMFPTNRAQRVIEDGPEESLFKLLIAAEETMQRPPDASTGRLMPSLRDRHNIELDEVVWTALLPESAHDLPVIVCGIDGESTFGMLRREALERPADEALAQALVNLADEPVELDEMRVGDLDLVVVTGSFYAAEKVLDRRFMLALHARIGAEILAVAVPTRGLLVATAADLEPAQIARFAALARLRHDESGGRGISPTVMLVSDGRIAGFVRDTTVPLRRPDRPSLRAETSPETPRSTARSASTKKPNFLRRLLGRK
jgi:hypothetical protein